MVSTVIYGPSDAPSKRDRNDALLATRVKSGPVQMSTIIASMPSQLTSKKRHICLSRQPASFVIAGSIGTLFCCVRDGKDGDEAIVFLPFLLVIDGSCGPYNGRRERGPYSG